MPKKFKLGVSLRIRPPFGQYNPEKLINLGTNRWAFKLGVAGSYTFYRKIILEGQVNTWVFTENKDFFGDNTLKQKPLLVAQVHLTYEFRPGVWIAGSYGRSSLGESIVSGVEKNDLKDNSRFGAAFAFRLSKHHGIKFAYTNGLSTRIGADFSTLLIAYQFMWFDGEKKLKSAAN